MKKLIQEYKFLCEEASKYSNHGQMSFQSENTNKNSINRSLSKSHKKIKTRIYCQNCNQNLFPQEYYLHVKDCHESSLSPHRN